MVQLSRRTRLGLAVAALLVIAVTAWVWRSGDPKERRYVAYIGRFDTTNPGFDSLHLAVLTQYLDELNRSIPAVRLELAVFSNRNDWKISDSLYRTVLKDPRYAVVLDNTWGAHLQPVARVIRDNGIPVIALNADKGTADFGHRAVFLGHDDDVPPTIAGFVARELRASKAIVIAERNYPLSARFWPALEEQAIRVEDSMLVETDQVDPREAGAVFERLARYAERGADSKPQVLILTAHGAWSRPIIKFIDSTFTNAAIVGGPAIISRMTPEDRAMFGVGKRRNRLIVLTTNPVDALLYKVRADVVGQKLTSRFKGLNVELYVRRCLDATSLMRRVLADSSELSTPRFAARAMFERFFRDSVPAATLVGQYDLYVFDSQSRLHKDLYFDVYGRGTVRLHPRSVGLRPSGSAIAVIPNVRFGLDIQNVGDINFDRNTFHAEFYYWLLLDADREKDERLIQFRNLSHLDRRDPVLRRIGEDSLLYLLYRITGDFLATYDLSKYPMDRQDLDIQLEIVEPSEEMRISFDSDEFRRTQERMKEFTIPGWRIQDFYVTVDNVISPGLRGEGRLGDRANQRFKTLTVHLPVKRKVLEPFVVVVLPLLMIGVAAITLLQVRDLSFKHVGEVSMGVFLSIITYSIAYSDVTPNSDQLTRADYLLYATFLVVLANFLTIITLSSDVIVRWPIIKRLTGFKYIVAILYLLAVAVIPFI